MLVKQCEVQATQQLNAMYAHYLQLPPNKPSMLEAAFKQSTHSLCQRFFPSLSKKIEVTHITRQNLLIQNRNVQTIC